MKPLPRWEEAPIHKSHDRKNFDCGSDELNTFIARYARQSHEAGASKTYCAIDQSYRKTIFGFYTINPCHIELHHIPLSVRPSHGGQYALGGYRLARLAVAKDYQGQSLGGHLLANAVERCIRVSKEVGGMALLIDAKDDRAAKWYIRYGAVLLDDRPLSLIITYEEFHKARIEAGL